MEAEGEGKFTRRQTYEYIKDGKYGQVENAETETEVVTCLHIQATQALKRTQYERVREIEHGSFTPLVFSATGGMAPLRQLLLPTKDLFLSWQTNASRTTARRSAGSGAQSVFLW